MFNRPSVPDEAFVASVPSQVEGVDSNGPGLVGLGVRGSGDGDSGGVGSGSGSGIFIDSAPASSSAASTTDATSLRVPGAGTARVVMSSPAAGTSSNSPFPAAALVAAMNDAHLVSPALTSESESSEGQASGRATPVDVAGPPADAPGSLPTAQHAWTV